MNRRTSRREKWKKNSSLTSLRWGERAIITGAQNDCFLGARILPLVTSCLASVSIVILVIQWNSYDTSGETWRCPKWLCVINWNSNDVNLFQFLGFLVSFIFRWIILFFRSRFQSALSVGLWNWNFNWNHFVFVKISNRIGIVQFSCLFSIFYQIAYITHYVRESRCG